MAIARSIAQSIRLGRVRRGDALPGSRSLAAQLGVHRNTVLAALRELENEGWIETRPALGTYVKTDLPDANPRALRGLTPSPRVASRMGFEMRGLSPSLEAQRNHFARESLVKRGVLPLLGGMPDLRLLPTSELARAYRRALQARPSLLGYGDPFGDARLRTELGKMLGRVRGIGIAEAGLVITRGSQMALYLAARAILEPGDVVLVESLGYRPAWEALRLAGAKLVALPVDSDGVNTSAIETLCQTERVRAVYVTPHHQYPTTALLSATRRLSLLSLAKKYAFVIFEDDYDHEFHYDGRPALPLASADENGSVIYIGTLSKILAPGLRLGFMVAPEPVAERVAMLRTFVDRQGDLVMERAIADLLEDGIIERHTRKMRRIYHARRDALVHALQTRMKDVFRFRIPMGGLAIWAKTSQIADMDAWALRSQAVGVLVQTARRFTFEGRPQRALRLGFAPVNENEIDLAIRKLAACME